MSTKNLLQENTVRRFMTLAGNDKYASNFINETWAPIEEEASMHEEFDLEEGLYEDDGYGLEESEFLEEDDFLEEDFDLEEGYGHMEEDYLEEEMFGDDPLAGLDEFGGEEFGQMTESRMRYLLEQEEEDLLDDEEGEAPEPEAGDVDVEIEEADVDCLKTARDVLDSIIGAADAEAGAEEAGGEDELDLDMGGMEDMGDEEGGDMGGEEEEAPALQEITNEVLRRVTRRLLRGS